MKFFKIIKVILATTLLFVSIQGNTIAGEFNTSKLTLMCDFFSENKKQCNDEVVFLESKNTNNSIIGQCFSKYRSVKDFNDCLKYEYNPLIFLKHQQNRRISTNVIFEIKNEIIDICSRIKQDDVRYNCVKESYLLVEKGKRPNHWLENSCLYKNTTLTKFINCTRKIKNNSLDENTFIISIPNLISAMDSWDRKLNNRVSLYFNQVYKSCEAQYTKINAFECMDGRISKNLDSIISFDFSNSECFKYGTYDQFDKCLNRSN